MYDPLSPPQNLRIAGLGRRSLAALFDFAVMCAALFSYAHFFGEETSPGRWDVGGTGAMIILSVCASYWIAPEWLWGKSLGKLLFDLRVVSSKGQPCSLTQSVQRNVLRVVDIQSLYLVGFLAAKFNPLTQRLGDQWARTVVIHDRPIPLPPAVQ